MSIYDRCNATADANKTAQWAIYRRETWWKDAALWDDPGRNQSTTERDAFRAILTACGRQPVERYADVLDMVREVVDAMRHERPYHFVPLKDYLEGRGETLYWRKPGVSPAAYVVPLIAGA